jgi:excisionase family DNA binding protein
MNLFAPVYIPLYAHKSAGRIMENSMPYLSETLLTPTQVAARCQISAKTVLRAIQSGRLRAARLGTRGAYRITASAVDEWVASATVQPRRTTRLEAPRPRPRSASQPPLAGRLSVPRQLGRP